MLDTFIFTDCIKKNTSNYTTQCLNCGFISEIMGRKEFECQVCGQKLQLKEVEND